MFPFTSRSNRKYLTFYPLHCAGKTDRMRKKLLWAILPLLIVACHKPTSFDYLGVKNPKVIKFGLKESTIGAEVEYYNPNNYGFTMKRCEVNVYINNNYFGKSTLDSTIHIPKKDTFDLPVILVVDMTGTAMNVLNIFRQGQDSVLVKMDGTARIGRSGFYINYPIKYEGMQKIRF
jgi:LEA14-like dessication related protein